MLFGILTLIFFSGSAWYLAKRIDPAIRSWFFVLLFSLPLFSVQVLGIFSALDFLGLVLFGFFWFFLCVFFELHSPALKKIFYDIRSPRPRELILPVLFFFAVAVFGYARPIFDIDSLAYHLPIVSQLIRTQGIWDIFHAGFVGPNTYFPANHEALQAFLQILTATPNFNFLITLLAIYLFYASLLDLVRGRAMHRTLIFLSVFSVASIPFLFEQLLHFQVDLFLFALFGAFVAALFSAFQNRDHREMAKAFLLIGFVIGTKYNGVPQILIVLPILLAAIWYFRKWLRRIWWFPFLTLFTGAIWYIRNWIVTGNPIYPFGANLGFLKFEGHLAFLNDMADSSIVSAIFRDGMRSTGTTIFKNIYFENLVGEAGIWFILFTAFVCLGTFVLLFLKKKQTDFSGTVLFLLLFYLFIGETFVYARSPYTFRFWEATIRYSSAVFALIPIALILAAMYSKVARIAIGIFATLFFSYQILFKSFFVSQNHQAPFPDYPELLRHSEKNIISLAGITPYGLFEREGLQPIYVNIDGCQNCKYHDYRKEEKSIRAFPNEEKWKEALRTANVDYLMVGKVHYSDDGKELFESRWADRDSANFKKILATEKWVLYEVK